jgi:hypothetical protein
MLHNTTQLDEFQSALTPERLPRLEVFSIQVWQRVDSDYLALCTPQLMSSLAHIIQFRPRNLQSFEFYPRVPMIYYTKVLNCYEPFRCRTGTN